MSFWVRYIILKEQLGYEKEITLQKIEDKFGIEKRQEIEAELD